MGTIGGLIAMGVLLSGCAAGPSPKEQLAAAYKELDNPAPNYAEIIDASDTYLKATPTGPAAADALYLHGRALEEKSQRDPADAQRDSAEAYNYYSQALTQKPRPGLEGRGICRHRPGGFRRRGVGERFCFRLHRLLSIR